MYRQLDTLYFKICLVQEMYCLHIVHTSMHAHTRTHTDTIKYTQEMSKNRFYFVYFKYACVISHLHMLQILQTYFSLILWVTTNE
jgi:hypothetical protein